MKNVFLFLLFNMTVVMGQLFTNNGSYNSLTNQVGFCKQQSFDTKSRSTSTSPTIFQSGKVLFGVGLSHTQFQRSIVSCGKCIYVLSIDRFYHFNNELTEWGYNQPNNGGFTVMVFDECTDPICSSGFLDFDIYNEKQPVAYGNPTNIVWQFVPCPVDENDKIGFLICLGYNSCQLQNKEEWTMDVLFQKAIQENWFTLYPRNFRIGITSVAVQGEPLEDNQSWVWKSPHQALLEQPEWLIEWTNENGTNQSWVLDWTQYFNHHSTKGYRGGFVIYTDQQN